MEENIKLQPLVSPLFVVCPTKKNNESESVIDFATENPLLFASVRNPIKQKEEIKESLDHFPPYLKSASGNLSRFKSAKLTQKFYANRDEKEAVRPDYSKELKSELVGSSAIEENASNSVSDSSQSEE